MYRILISPEHERIYPGREEFEEAVRAGEIGPDALIHHAKSDRWILVCLHPDYKTAKYDARSTTALAAANEPDRPFWEKPLPPAPEATEPEPVAARHFRLKPTLLAMYAAAAVVLVALGGGAFWGFTHRDGVAPRLAGLLHRPETSQEGAVAANAPAVAPATATTELATASSSPPESDARVVASASRSEPGVPDTGTELFTQTSTSKSGAGAASLGRLRPREANDLSTLADWVAQDLKIVGFDDLLSPSRLADPDQVRAARRTLAAAANIFATYRVDARRLSETHPALRANAELETFEMAEIADSLGRAVDSLLIFLESRPGRYLTADTGITFRHPDETARYRGLRSRVRGLIDEEAAVRISERRPLAPPMAQLRRVIQALGD